MKRTLLFVPVLAIALMGCPARHTTGYNGSYTHEKNEEITIINGDTVSHTITTTTTTATGVTSSVDTITTNVSTPTDSSKYTRMIVSFISKGEGINLQAKADLDKWLSKHPDYPYIVTQKGREGETKYCFMMSGKNNADRTTFIRETKTFMSGKELVIVTENVICEHQHLAVVEEDAPIQIVDTNIVRLKVSFISKGEGIDYQTKEEFEKWLGMREKFVYEMRTWGREGEFTYCFRMTNVSTREQDIFVKDVRTFLTDKPLVVIEEMVKCGK